MECGRDPLLLLKKEGSRLLSTLMKRVDSTTPSPSQTSWLNEFQPSPALFGPATPSHPAPSLLVFALPFIPKRSRILRRDRHQQLFDHQVRTSFERSALFSSPNEVARNREVMDHFRRLSGDGYAMGPPTLSPLQPSAASVDLSERRTELASNSAEGLGLGFRNQEAKEERDEAASSAGPRTVRGGEQSGVQQQQQEEDMDEEAGMMRGRQASRSIIRPSAEAGMVVEPKEGAKIEFVDYLPAAFRDIRQALGIDRDAYIAEWSTAAKVSGG